MSNVLVGVTGCIAAYKAAELVRLFQKRGHDVRVVMTQNATKFIAPLTFEALTHHRVTVDLFDDVTPIPHIENAKWADHFVIAPCTANVIAKLSGGIADDALTSTALAYTGKLHIAPAMNVHMWEHQATQANLQNLAKRGVQIIEPTEGNLACGYSGKGHLADIEAIAEAVLGSNQSFPQTTKPADSFYAFDQDLAGLTFLITAGPTREYIDPVRYLSNPSTGKMGYALAEAAVKRGAHVILVHGPCNLEVPQGVYSIDCVSAQDMYAACMKHIADANVMIGTAAVSDCRPTKISKRKLKKTELDLSSLAFERTQDILASCATHKRPGTTIVGFAAETHDVLKYAQSKLAAKHCDLIVANDVSCAESTFGSHTNKVWVVGQKTTQELPVMSKRELADVLLDHIIELRS